MSVCYRGHKKPRGQQCKFCHRDVARNYARSRQQELLAARRYFGIERRPYGSRDGSEQSRREDMALIRKYRKAIAE